MYKALPGRAIPQTAFAAGMLLVCLLFASQCHADGDAETVPPEIVNAIKGLKTADSDARQKTFDLLAAKGDARLIPALKAYKDNLLLLREDRLMTYGPRTSVEGKSVVPLIDALTGQPIAGPDGKPVYYEKVDLTGAISAPRVYGQKKALGDLIATLSLLDPDPVARTASIRDAAEHAARAMPDPADAARFLDSLSKCAAVVKAHPTTAPSTEPSTAPSTEANALQAFLTVANAAQIEKPVALAASAPGSSTMSRLSSALGKAQDATKDDTDEALQKALADLKPAISSYSDQVDLHQKVLDDLPKTLAALKSQFEKDPKGPFASPLHEAIASIELVTTDDANVRISSAEALGKIATGRAANLLEKVAGAADRMSDKKLANVSQNSLHSANAYQTEVHVIQNTFAGLSLGSILVLMALGLSIIFGLMGVINMAQGEFMMVGAFTTFVVAQFFRQHFSAGAYNYYLLVAVPAAFLVAASLGIVVETLVVRHLYGRPLDSLLATWGIGLILVWAVRWKFGDNVSVAPPRWMEGGWEVAPDMVFPLNRLYIILFCAICIGIVYFIINGTKLGLLLRATTQNREMASALGVPTRRVDGLTFAFGAGLAGLAGVAVPLYNKINPNIGQEYIVDCFMVVVVGGVGKLAGAIWAGLGLGFIGKYLEAALSSWPALASGASVIGKVLVLLLIIVFLQWRPQGLFPPKGRNADA